MSTVLISADDLAARIAAGETLRILDVRWALGGPPGHGEYLKGHIPGAVFVDIETELAAPPVPELGRHPMPPLAELQASARRWGLHTGDTVIAYDDSGNTSAARAWWLLRWGSFDNVLLLDGGLGAWKAAGGTLAEDDVAPAPGDVTLTPGGMPTLTIDDAAALARDGLLLDARAAERYRGEVEPVDPIAGHIPGAVSAPTTANLGSDGRFLPAAELTQRFADLGVQAGEQVGVYCGSGVTAAHEVFALAVAGHEAALYPGSWSQWSNTPGRPVATGS